MEDFPRNYPRWVIGRLILDIHHAREVDQPVLLSHSHSSAWLTEQGSSISFALTRRRSAQSPRASEADWHGRSEDHPLAISGHALEGVGCGLISLHCDWRVDDAKRLRSE